MIKQEAISIDSSIHGAFGVAHQSSAIAFRRLSGEAQMALLKGQMPRKIEVQKYTQGAHTLMEYKFDFDLFLVIMLVVPAGVLVQTEYPIQKKVLYSGKGQFWDVYFIFKSNSAKGGSRSVIQNYYKIAQEMIFFLIGRFQEAPQTKDFKLSPSFQASFQKLAQQWDSETSKFHPQRGVNKRTNLITLSVRVNEPSHLQRLLEKKQPNLADKQLSHSDDYVVVLNPHQGRENEQELGGAEGTNAKEAYSINPQINSFLDLSIEELETQFPKDFPQLSKEFQISDVYKDFSKLFGEIFGYKQARALALLQYWFTEVKKPIVFKSECEVEELSVEKLKFCICFNSLHKINTPQSKKLLKKYSIEVKEAKVFISSPSQNRKERQNEPFLNANNLNAAGFLNCSLPETDQSDYDWYSNFAYNKKSKTLVVHDYLLLVSKLKEILPEREEYSTAALTEIVLMSGFVLNLPLAGEEIITEIYRKNANIQESPILPLTLQEGHLNITPRSFSPRFELIDSEKRVFLREGLSSPWSRFFHIAINGLGEGITEKESYVSGADSVKRKNDLLLLRHQGVSLFVFCETIHWLILQKRSLYPLLFNESKPLNKNIYTDKNEEQFLLDLQNNISQILEIDIKGDCSQQTKEVITSYIRSIQFFCDQAGVFFYNNQLFQWDELKFFELTLIDYWLSDINFISKGILFKKHKMQWLPESLLVKDNEETNKKDFSDEAHEGAFFRSEEPLFFPKNQTKIPWTLFYGTTSTLRPLNYPIYRWQGVSKIFGEKGYKLFLENKELTVLRETDFRVTFAVSPLFKEGRLSRSKGALDWFELHPRYFLKENEITEKQAQKLAFEGVLEHKGVLYFIDLRILPCRNVLLNFWRNLSTQKKSQKELSSNSEGGKFTLRHHILDLLAYRSLGITFEPDADWDRICRHFDRMSRPQRKLTLPKTLAKDLLPFQKSGVQWLWDLFQLQIGGLLGDDMGLGKTAQTLSFLLLLKEKRLLKKSLVVVPASLTYNWRLESEKFTPQLRLQIFDPKEKIQKNTEVLVVTYNLLAIHEEFFTSLSWTVIVFDEAQNLKNIGSKRFSASSQLVGDFKVALTGTPFENNLSELYALLTSVLPGCLGTRRDFHDQFGSSVEVDLEITTFLKKKVKPLLLRRKKTEVQMQLPEKTESIVDIHFSPKQEELYRKTAISWNRQIDQLAVKGNQQGGVSQLMMLTALMRLRQICSDPAAVPGITYKEVPPKIETLLEMLNEITLEGHSALVFTQFLTTLERVKTLLIEAGIDVFVLHGAVPRKEREKILEGFNNHGCLDAEVVSERRFSNSETIENVYGENESLRDGVVARMKEKMGVHHEGTHTLDDMDEHDILDKSGRNKGKGKGRDSQSETIRGAVLLMTLKTGGVGLNLTKATYVFHMEPWWNPAVEDQATDRVHRIGQNRAVTVYRLIMKNSIEEKVQELKQKKKTLFEQLFGDSFFDIDPGKIVQSPKNEKPSEVNMLESIAAISPSTESNSVNITGLTKEDFFFLISDGLKVPEVEDINFQPHPNF